MKKSIKITTACISLAVAVGMGAYVFSLKKGDEDVPVVSISQVETTVPVVEFETEFVLPDNWSDNVEYVPSDNGITAKAKVMNSINPDYIAWMKIGRAHV